MLDLIGNLGLGFATALSPINLALCFLGCLVGTLIGVLPGVGPIATIAMLLPLTFKVDPTGALIMLAGIYYGAQYGGSTTAILVNIPGEATAVVTTLDGHAMARNGQAGVALGIAALASFFAGTVATLVIDTEGSQFDTTLSLRSTDCATEVKCDDEGGAVGNTSKLTLNGVAPGGYAIVVDGWTTTSFGPLTLNVLGTVAQGTSCSSPLFSGGAAAVLVCPAGTPATFSRSCQSAMSRVTSRRSSSCVISSRCFRRASSVAKRGSMISSSAPRARQSRS